MSVNRKPRAVRGFLFEGKGVNDKDWNFLKKHFQDAVAQVNGDETCMRVLNRKIAHSQRVLQNGILIMEHDLPDLAPETRNLAEQALLFHDIGRFSEVVLSYQNQSMQGWGRKYDHGRLGAEILAQTPQYNRMEIVLAVRHHGHLIEDFYQDEFTSKSSSKSCATPINSICTFCTKKMMPWNTMYFLPT